jgi:hypothetical protein
MSDEPGAEEFGSGKEGISVEGDMIFVYQMSSEPEYKQQPRATYPCMSETHYSLAFT